MKKKKQAAGIWSSFHSCSVKLVQVKVSESLSGSLDAATSILIDGRL